MTVKPYALKMLKRVFDYEFKDAVVQASITQESNTNTTYNPSTGTVTNSGTPVVNRGLLRRYKSKYIDHNKVQQSDRKLTLIQSEWLTYIPEEGDKVTIGSQEWNVVSITEDSVNVSWSLQLRGV